ncbi:MAG: matrixin family metalloprotease [Pseudomonadota bacterium]
MKRRVACRTALVIGAALAFSGFTAFRDPNRQDAVRWSATNVEISLQQDGSADLGDGSDLAAMRAALATWQASLPTGFTLSEGATSSSRSYGDDGVNRVTFLEQNWPAGADTALGTTLPHVAGGRFVDVDILLNGTDGPWSVDGNPAGIDIRSVVTHELGHLLGLWHAFDAHHVMYTGARSGTTFRRALADDDVRGVRQVASSGLSCQNDQDCPLLVEHFGGSHLRLTCQSNTCQQGLAGYGAECLNDSHCQSDSCLRDPWTGNGRDPGVCTRTCNVGASDCPGGDLCKDVSGTGTCVPGRDCLEDADCGGGANDFCLFAFDGRYRCQRLCMLDAHCQSPMRCIDLDYGAGVCVAPGPNPNNAPCLSPMDCMGLACRGDENTLRCATAAPRQDGGVTPDIPVAPDGWTPGDAGGTDRSGTDGGARDVPIPDTADYAGLPPDEEGCACQGTQGRGSAVAMLALLVLHRRRRRA